jgi:CheY-like chemotaxis protein
MPGLRKILVAEDNQALRQMYYDFLQAHGFEVRVAVDGRDALEVAKNFVPELLFLDVMMPELDGLQVATLLRTDPSYNCQDIKIVLLSNLGRDKVPQEVIDEVDGYALKAGIKLADLLDIIHSLETP